ncbi:unnamed protein product [Neisseria lactamica Y92-1009]|nr:unnamed protein product [Neisseria lactamica Y92-1009]
MFACRLRGRTVWGRMKKKLLSGIKFAVQTALVFLSVSLFLDWVRKPDEPAGAAGRPFDPLSGQAADFGTIGTG